MCGLCVCVCVCTRAAINGCLCTRNGSVTSHHLCCTYSSSSDMCLPLLHLSVCPSFLCLLSFLSARFFLCVFLQTGTWGQDMICSFFQLTYHCIRDSAVDGTRVVQLLSLLLEILSRHSELLSSPPVQEATKSCLCECVKVALRHPQHQLLPQLLRYNNIIFLIIFLHFFLYFFLPRYYKSLTNLFCLPPPFFLLSKYMGRTIYARVC